MNNRKYVIIAIVAIILIGISTASIVTSTVITPSITVNGQPWNTQINVSIPSLVAGSTPVSNDYTIHNNADQPINVTVVSTYKNYDGNLNITYSPSNRITVVPGTDVVVTVFVYAKPAAIGSYVVTTTTTPS